MLRSIIRQLFDGSFLKEPPLISISGGCINNAGMFSYEGKSYFLKWNSDVRDLFEKEQKGLTLLKRTGAISVPEVIGFGKSEGYDFLCLSYIEKHVETKQYWGNLGRQLASLHKNTSSHFGLDFDNHIGRLIQKNTKCVKWADFFVNHRLKPQVQFSLGQDLLGSRHADLFERLYAKLPDLIPEEKPALLHGDLWSGNVMCGQEDTPYIFDPAVYFGHREAELAFTKLFGGFGQDFYNAYNDSFPLSPNFNERIDLYNLYPLLVHLNLFGVSYRQGIEDILRQFT